MSINDLSAFVATLLAVSLATERLVVVAKTSFPTWLADEKKTPAQETDLIRDRWRRIRVQLVALAAAWVTAAALANFDPTGEVPLGADGSGSIPVPLLALLSMGGSALWTSIVGYASALKDIRTLERASGSLGFHARAREQGLTAVDAGTAAVARGASRAAPGLTAAIERIGTLDQPPLQEPASRVARHG
ncbi:MAG TPA: hypothetical protein VFU46_09235 [Gemmatimonadales bacterium]|nr:hypothetical protein [Gemmatimonadales bacterium]